MRKVIVLLLSVLMLCSFATVAFAEDGDSAEITPEFSIEIINDFDTEEPGVNVTVEDGDVYTLTPEQKPGYEWEDYEIEGDYEIISQNDETGVWVIKPKTSLVIHVKYKNTETKPNPHDDKPVSPPTGVNALPYTALILIGVFGVMLATKKLVKTH